MISSTYSPGTRCWIPDDKEGWVGAEIKTKDVEGEKVKLTLILENGEKKTIDTTQEAINSNSESLPPLRNPPILETTEDLTSLSYLNEPAVLNAIKMRYAQLNIYTYSGIVLIATNPFQRVDNLYSPDIIQAYAGRKRGELEPHLFAIAEDAYRCMLRDNTNQTIVVSGESGAGKTVSAKYIMRYFATVEDPDRPHTHGHGNAHDALSHTEEQILATNPIMEAFGNAKTTRNDNSSRFGKYLEIIFDEEVEIIGAKIRTYLLERSRLVFQPSTERNYHIFYQLCSGATEQMKEEFDLLPIDQFHYLNQGGDHKIAGVDEAEEFEQTKRALHTVDMDDKIQHQVFQVLAGLLHIGNIQITATRTNAILSSEEPSLVKAAKLLGLDALAFSKWIVKKQITTRSEKIVSNLSQKQALVVRDSVAKYIYSILFDWLVQVINGGLFREEIQERAKSFIGVLDIYGFEHFKTNSFEQFCINYANEKLQQEFNQHVFKLEQDEYVREEIEWTFIEFSDNQPCISLIENKLGVLSLLDEESRLPAGNDEGFVHKLYQSFDLKDKSKETFFKRPRFGNTGFIIKHYAMDVSYESEGFIEKNRDTVPDELIEVLENTENSFLQSVLETTKDEPVAPAPSKLNSRAVVNRKPTLGSIFKKSLIELMATINSTNVHYIRCIKTNDEKAAWKFEGPLVLSQLRACGVLETIRISCAGFPTRWTYEEFASRYYMLIPSSEWSKNIKPLCDAILQKCINVSDIKYQLGKTKIFFRAGMLAYLEKLRSERLHECAVIIQKNLRMVYYRKQYQRTRQSIIDLQSVSRAYLGRLTYQQKRTTKAAVVIQKNWRGYRALEKYKKTRLSIVELQRCIRGFLLRQSLLKQRYNSAATTIQRHWKGYSARKEFNQRRNNIIIVQNLVRRRRAIKKLKTLKIEAKSVTHYREVQYRLENKVVELTQSLGDKRQENKKLLNVIEGLQSQIVQWQKRHADHEQQTKDLLADHDDAKSQIMREMQAIQASYDKLKIDHTEIVEKLTGLENTHDELKNDVLLKETKLQEANEAILRYQKNEASLTETINQLKTDLANAAKNVSANAPSFSPLRNIGNGGTSASVTKKRTKRHSLTNSSFANQVMEAVGYSPRPASIAIPNSSVTDGNWNHRRQFSSSTDVSVGSTGLNADIERILENESILYAEVIQGLIFNLKIPVPNTTERTTIKEILFPANIINLITSEMWRLGFVKESEKFLGQVMNAIQDLMTRLSGEAIINPGAFWLSNVHDMYSFICLAESNIVRNVSLLEEMGEFEFNQYGQLVTVVKRDLENLEFNVYHMWMKEIKKILDKMIAPAVVTSQSLPGFIEHESTRFLSKVFTSGSQAYTMDDLISLFNKVYKALEAYYLEPEFMKQPIIELLRLVGVKSFNDLLMRRGFLTWKRGLQINYNITRVEEWCKTHNVAEGILRLEHIMQSVKLLQLKKSSFDDVEIIYDVCWTLSPAQIQKLMQQYSVADYEQPISTEILSEVAARVKNDSNSTLLLEAIPLDDSGPFEIVDPRPLKRIESYIPGWIQVPNLKRLAELTAAVNSTQQQQQQQASLEAPMEDGEDLSIERNGSTI